MGNGNKPTDLYGQLEKANKGHNVVRSALVRLLTPSERKVLYCNQVLEGTSILTLKHGQNTVLHSNC